MYIRISSFTTTVLLYLMERAADTRITQLANIVDSTQPVQLTAI